jgi:hypothetical protein
MLENVEGIKEVITANKTYAYQSIKVNNTKYEQ